MGEEYEKLPRVVPYIMLPIGCGLLLFRLIQATIEIARGTRDSLIVSHEAEDRCPCRFAHEQGRIDHGCRDPFPVMIIRFAVPGAWADRHRAWLLVHDLPARSVQTHRSIPLRKASIRRWRATTRCWRSRSSSSHPASCPRAAWPGGSSVFSIAVVGHLPGGLAIAGVFACMMFAALSGSSPATVVAIGSIVIAGMRQVGYSKEFAAGVICNAGTLGILIPPSIVMVVYASATDVSVGRMFLAGVIPGLLAGRHADDDPSMPSPRSATCPRVTGWAGARSGNRGARPHGACS